MSDTGHDDADPWEAHAGWWQREFTDGADLASLLGSWGTCSGCGADIDGNGLVDGADLASLLGGWGACP